MIALYNTQHRTAILRLVSKPDWPVSRLVGSEKHDTDDNKCRLVMYKGVYSFLIAFHIVRKRF